MSPTLNFFVFNKTGIQFDEITIVGANFGNDPAGVVLSTNDKPGIPFAEITTINDTHIVATLKEYEAGPLDVRVRKL